MAVKKTRKPATKKKVVAKKPAAKKKVVAKKVVVKKKVVKKTTAKKTVAKRKPAVTKTTAKKTTVKPVAVKKSKTTAVKTPFTKTQLYTEISEVTGLTRKQVGSVFEELGTITQRHIKKGAVGEIKIPGIQCKILTVKKPATKAREGINPFTGELTMFKAKPARTLVKVRPLKGLKEAAA